MTLKLYFRFRYLLSGGRNKLRNWYHSPIYLRLTKIYENTSVGKTSKVISDRSHDFWSKFWEYSAYKLSLYRIRRRFGFAAVTLGAYWLGFFIAGWG